MWVARVCGTGPGVGSDGKEGFSPFLFRASSFVAFCCAITFWGERLPELGFPDSLLMTEPFSLGDLLEVTIATGSRLSFNSSSLLSRLFYLHSLCLSPLVLVLSTKKK